jgi:hypothetical protein
MKKCKCGGIIRKYVMCGGVPKLGFKHFEECGKCFKMRVVYNKLRNNKENL